MNNNIINSQLNGQSLTGNSNIQQALNNLTLSSSGFDMKGKKIINLGTGNLSTDAVNLGQMATAISQAVSDPQLLPSLSDINTAKPLNGNLDLRGGFQVLVNPPSNNNEPVRLTDLNVESSSRIISDNQLQTQINVESSSRIISDNILQTKIDDEILARDAADILLQNQIDNIIAQGGVSQQQLDDAITALDNDLQAQITQIQTTDLPTINTLITDLQNEDLALQTQITSNTVLIDNMAVFTIPALNSLIIQNSTDIAGLTTRLDVAEPKIDQNYNDLLILQTTTIPTINTLLNDLDIGQTVQNNRLDDIDTEIIDIKAVNTVQADQIIALQLTENQIYTPAVGQNTKVQVFADNIDYTIDNVFKKRELMSTDSYKYAHEDKVQFQSKFNEFKIQNDDQIFLPAQINPQILSVNVNNAAGFDTMGIIQVVNNGKSSIDFGVVNFQETPIAAIPNGQLNIESASFLQCLQNQNDNNSAFVISSGQALVNNSILMSDNLTVDLPTMFNRKCGYQAGIQVDQPLQFATKDYVDTNSGGVAAPIVNYTQESIAGSQNYLIPHNLGLTFEQLTVKVLVQVKTAGNGYSVGDIIDPNNDNYIGSSSGSGSGFIASSVNANNIRISTGNNSIFHIPKNGGFGGLAYTSVRLLITIFQTASPLILQSNSINLSNVIPDANYSLTDKKISTTATTFSGGEFITKEFADLNYSGGGSVANLNQIPPPISAYNFGAQRLENLATPTFGTHATTKTYVDNKILTELNLYTPEVELIRNPTNQAVQIVATNSLLNASGNLIRGALTPDGTNNTDVATVEYVQQQVLSGLAVSKIQSNLSTAQLGFSDISTVERSRNLIYTPDGSFPSFCSLQRMKLQVGAGSYSPSQINTAATCQIQGISGSPLEVYFGETSSTNLCILGGASDNVIDFNRRILSHVHFQIRGMDERAFKFVVEPWNSSYVYTVNPVAAIISPAYNYSLLCSNKIRCEMVEEVSPSSLDYKKKISNFNHDMGDIIPVHFKFRKDAPVHEDEKKKQQTGVIYEQVDSRYHLSDNGVKKVDYSKLHTDMLYWHQQQIKSLLDRINYLEQKLI